MDKLKRGNYKGLNLTEIRITLIGEVSIAEQAIREAQEMNVKEGIEELFKRANELRELLKRVSEAVQRENEIRAVLPDKCGARLKAKDELQEWLEKQEELRRNPEQAGANIFTYRHSRGRRQQDLDFAASESLINDVTLMRLKSAKSLSGQPTKENSVSDDFKKWSFFEKMERLKRKVKQAHRLSSIGTLTEPDRGIKTEVIHLTDGI